MSTYIQLRQSQRSEHCEGPSAIIEIQTDVSCPSDRGQVFAFALACPEMSMPCNP
jgi:hypothetical protein